MFQNNQFSKMTQCMSKSSRKFYLLYFTGHWATYRRLDNTPCI